MSKVTSLFIFADSFVSEVSFVIYQSVQHKYNLKLCWITANAFRISDCNLYVNRDRQAEQNCLLKGTKMFRFNSKSRGFDEYWSMEGGKVLMNESLPLDGQKKNIFTKDFEEVINQNYQLSEVTADSFQEGNGVLPVRMYHQEVASAFLLTKPFHINLAIIIINTSYCLYDVLILVSV